MVKKLRHQSRASITLLQWFALCVSLLWPPLTYSATAQVLPPLEFVIAGLEESFQRIQSGSAVVEKHEEISQELLAVLHQGEDPKEQHFSQVGNNYVREIDSRWYFENESISVSMYHSLPTPLPQRGTIVRSRMLVNHDEYRFLQEYRRPTDSRATTDYAGVRALGEQFLQDGLPTINPEADPRYHGYFWGDMRLANFLRQRSSLSRVEKETTLFDSQHVLQVSVDTENHLQTTTFWIDEDHSFLIRKAMVTISMKGNPVETISLEVPALTKSGEVYLPAQVNQAFHLCNRDTGKLLGVVNTTYTIKDVSIGNQPPPEVFELNFPQGTSVSDHIDLRTYTVTWVADEGGEEIGGGVPKRKEEKKREKPAE